MAVDCVSLLHLTTPKWGVVSSESHSTSGMQSAARSTQCAVWCTQYAVRSMEPAVSSTQYEVSCLQYAIRNTQYEASSEQYAV